MKTIAAILALGWLTVSGPQALAGDLPAMTVWKSPFCGCCGAWVDHMRAAGFKVAVKEVDSLSEIKRSAGVPEKLQSCHTARIGGYTVEGHVPAADVKRLLKARPKVHGLAVPGMPIGSPGMETGPPEPYDVVTFTRDGKTEVFARHK